jgi:hypoxanthine phosphoribosyltransferase
VNTRILQWDDFAEMCDDLYGSLMWKNFDGIVSIGQGGTIVGSILAKKLGTRVCPVFVTHRGTDKDKITEIIQLGVASDLERGSYLLVDDECFTGETFDILKKALPNLHLETASLICREDYQPDYCTCSSDEKIVFPYYSIS